MLKRIVFLAAVSAVLTQGTAVAAEKLKVVTTTTTYADIVRQIGGDRVEVKAVAPPKFNIHFIQPRPSDVRSVSKADLLVHSGLDHEHWTDPLVEAAGREDLFRGNPKNLDMSKDVPILEIPEGSLSRAEGDIHLFGNPHFQMGPENGRIFAKNVAEKLVELDPEGAPLYEKNAAEFTAKLDLKLAEWKALCAHCEGKELISYHKDIVYLASFLGVRVDRFFEPKPGIPPSPQQAAELERYMKEKKIPAIIMPVYYPRQGAELLAGRAGAVVKTVTQNLGEVEGTDDYFSFFDYNVKTIAEVTK